jgi:hypothetical protein
MKFKELTHNFVEKLCRETGYLQDMRWVDTMKVDWDGGRLMELAQPLAKCGFSFSISIKFVRCHCFNRPGSPYIGPHFCAGISKVAMFGILYYE